jgi:hypothetical protein
LIVYDICGITFFLFDNILLIAIIYLIKEVFDMKNHKALLTVGFVGLGLLGFVFLYDLIFAIAANMNPAIPMEAMVFALPLAVGLLLVPYAVKSENRKLIYIGNMINIASSLAFVYQTASLCLAGISGALAIALLISMIWPLLALATSLTMMAFIKKADFKRIHNIVLMVSLIGVLVSILITALTITIFSINMNGALIFGSLLPTIFVFMSVAPAVFMAFALKDKARLVKLEVAELVKPVKPSPAPKEEPKQEVKEEASQEPVEQKEDTPEE